MRAATSAFAEPVALGRSRLADYVELTKPRISVMVLITVAAGALLGSSGIPDWWLLWHTLLGTALVAAGASALNQFLERDSDALMERTENRPLPAGRLQASEVLLLGSVLGIAGVAYLAIALPRPLAAVTAALTFFCYVFVYTPLKRRTSLNTLVGAVPGALPPVIGWAAVRGSIDWDILGLFAILFIWQVPHFLAIAWIYRDDYGRHLRARPCQPVAVGVRSGRCRLFHRRNSVGCWVPGIRDRLFAEPVDRDSTRSASRIARLFARPLGLAAFGRRNSLEMEG